MTDYLSVYIIGLSEACNTPHLQPLSTGRKLCAKQLMSLLMRCDVCELCDKARSTYPEVCEAIFALHILHPEPDLSVGISLILQPAGYVSNIDVGLTPLQKSKVMSTCCRSASETSKTRPFRPSAAICRHRRSGQEVDIIAAERAELLIKSAAAQNR